MALIEKIKAIADAIRAKTGMTGTLTLDEMAETITHLETDESTYILVDDYGNEVLATLVDDEVVLTSTPNDIRLGTTAITDSGFVVGEKEIPAYHTREGAKLIEAGKTCQLSGFTDYNFTKLQALFCRFNGAVSRSVATYMVSINEVVYNSDSIDAVATVTIDDANKAIMFGVTNNSDNPIVIRYFTYREEY